MRSRGSNCRKSADRSDSSVQQTAQMPLSLMCAFEFVGSIIHCVTQESVLLSLSLCLSVTPYCLNILLRVFYMHGVTRKLHRERDSQRTGETGETLELHGVTLFAL